MVIINPPIDNSNVNSGKPMLIHLSICHPIKKAARMTAISLKARLE